MDDRRFDSLVKALAEGKSRRTVLKGLLGLGGAALTGGVLLEGDSEAARRPSSTPTPRPTCPGQQTWTGSACACISPPAPGTAKCGPDCCNSTGLGPTHSECCDNECCFGTCYGEELCCPTNSLPGEQPSTHKICQSAGNGTECCPRSEDCCVIDGCCDTVCWGGEGDDAFCCAPESFCPGGNGELCCTNSDSALFTCCGANTATNACIDLSVEGACCDDGECGDPCQVCNAQTHTCGPRCGAHQVCCTEQAGPGVCVTGACCPGIPSCDGGEICCQAASGTICLDTDVCPSSCSDDEPCAGCATCVDGLCRAGCGQDQVCCQVEGVDTCVAEGACTPNGCTCEDVDECCFINDVFVGCVDLTQDGACCTAATCGLEDPDNCLVSACTGFRCEQVSECLAGEEVCCDGDCIAGDSCAQCVNPVSCAAGQTCCPDFICCNGSCIEGTTCGAG